MEESGEVQSPGFEKTLEELEQLIRSMEGSEVPLDELVGKYERGTALKKKCEELLKAAELRIEQLKESGAVPEFESLDANSVLPSEDD